MSRLHAPLMALRKQRIGNQDDPTYIPESEFSIGHVGPDWLANQLRENTPLMAVRFGNTELNNMIPVFLQARAGFRANLRAYLRGDIPQFWFKEFLLQEADLNAGVFPYGKPTVRRFANLVLDLLPEIDLLGCWLYRERYLHHLFPNAVHMAATQLCGPCQSDEPWTAALAGQRVLVIHPFAETIASQYRNKREQLFSNPHVLPAFDLVTLTALQTNARNRPGDFADWFAVYDHLRLQVDALKFDVALIGCGAYGMPLAAHVKRMGRKAVQMASGVQPLFGIRGRRWDESPFAARFYNEAWVRPSAAETPRSPGVVENGCYW